MKFMHAMAECSKTKVYRHISIPAAGTHPSIAPEDFKESMLNEVEIANRDLIVSYEKEMGYR